MTKLIYILTLLIAFYPFLIFAEIQCPELADIVEFNADPINSNHYFKDFKIERKDLEDIIKTYYQVSKDKWEHNYSHVAAEDRTGTIKLRDGRIIQWMVRPGGLATFLFPDNKIIYLVKSKP